MPRFLILDNSVDQNHYKPALHWSPFLTDPVDVFTARRNELPPTLAPYTHMILTGSEASVLDREPWVLDVMDITRKAVEAGMVVLGGCFGHQLLAAALFGPESVRRMKTPEIGWTMIRQLPGQRVLGSPGETFAAFNYHSDEVCSVPEERVDVLAASDASAIHAFKMKDKPVWGIQSHPEIGIGEGLRVIEALSPGKALDRKRYLNDPVAGPKASGWICSLMKEFCTEQPV